MEDSIFKLKSIFVVLPTQIGNSTIICPFRLVTKSSISIVLQGICVPAGRIILGWSSLNWFARNRLYQAFIHAIEQ